MASIKGKVIEQTIEEADEHLKKLAKKNISELENTTIENLVISKLS